MNKPQVSAYEIANNKPYEPMKDPIFLANQLFRVLREQGYETRSKNKDGEWIGEGKFHSVDINVHWNEEMHLHVGTYKDENRIKGRYEPDGK